MLGVMIDCSRNAVMNVRTVSHFLDISVADIPSKSYKKSMRIAHQKVLNWCRVYRRLHI